MTARNFNKGSSGGSEIIYVGRHELGGGAAAEITCGYITTKPHRVWVICNGFPAGVEASLGEDQVIVATEPEEPHIDAVVEWFLSSYYQPDPPDVFDPEDYNSSARGGGRQSVPDIMFQEFPFLPYHFIEKAAERVEPYQIIKNSWHLDWIPSEALRNNPFPSLINRIPPGQSFAKGDERKLADIAEASRDTLSALEQAKANGPGVGHNNPPLEFRVLVEKVAQLEEDVRTLKEASSAPQPDVALIGTKASRLQWFREWMSSYGKRLIERAAESGVKSWVTDLDWETILARLREVTEKVVDWWPF